MVIDIRLIEFTQRLEINMLKAVICYFSVRAPVGRINIANKKIILGRGLSAIRHRIGFQTLLSLILTNKFTENDMIGNGAIYKISK